MEVQNTSKNQSAVMELQLAVSSMMKKKKKDS